MSQARFFAGASSRVVERSTIVFRSQRPYIGIGRSSELQLQTLGVIRCYPATGNGRSLFSSRSFIPHPRYVRSVSTNPPQTSSSKSSESPLPPPPSAPGIAAKVKPKVDLRPGPTKPSVTSPSSPPQADTVAASKPPNQSQEVNSPSKPHSTKPPPVTSTLGKEDILKDEEGASIVEIAKKDVADAARHGILAPPPADAGTIRRLVHQVKELFKFYWAGLKLVFANSREARSLKSRADDGGPPLTWTEHRFILTNKSDLVKMVPFVLIVLVLEEVIPLIVMYVPGMLPSTCVLPSQRARIDAKRHERQREAYAHARDANVFGEVNTEDTNFRKLGSSEVSVLCSTVGLSSWGILGMQQRRLGKYLRSLADDDALLLSEGKGARLNQSEIAEALWERGLLADAYSPAEQRNRLRWWLDNFDSSNSHGPASPKDARLRLLLHMHQQYKSS